MSSGTSDSAATNKTEFQRYADAWPEKIPPFARRYREFKTIPECKHFGGWLRGKHLPEFNAVYQDWWKAHPELFGVIYQDTPQDLLSVK